MEAFVSKPTRDIRLLAVLAARDRVNCHALSIAWEASVLPRRQRRLVQPVQPMIVVVRVGMALPETGKRARAARRGHLGVCPCRHPSGCLPRRNLLRWTRD